MQADSKYFKSQNLNEFHNVDLKGIFNVDLKLFSEKEKKDLHSI